MTVAHLQNLWAHLGFLGVFLGRNCLNTLSATGRRQPCFAFDVECHMAAGGHDLKMYYNFICSYCMLIIFVCTGLHVYCVCIYRFLIDKTLNNFVKVDLKFFLTYAGLYVRVWKKIWGQNNVFHPKICITSVQSQLHLPTSVCLKFQAKTTSGYGETALTRFAQNLRQKNNVKQNGNF